MARRLWRDYFIDCSAVVFVIDSSCRKRFDESRHELEGLLRDPALESVTFLILANKVDIAGSVSYSEIVEAFRLDGAIEDPFAVDAGSRGIHLAMTSIRQKYGFMEGFRWLARRIADGN
jgi:GTP-binding protein SAR1